MKRLLFGIPAAIFAAGLFAGVAWYRNDRTTSDAASAGGRKILYYVDPMNPAHKTQGPGMAPCGMKMEPVYADGFSDRIGVKISSSVSGGTLNISTLKRQLSGVLTDEVKRQSIRHSFRWPGRVELDQARIYQINAALDGRVVGAQTAVAGTFVKKNEVLASYYSPEFLHPAQVLLFALKAEEQMAARKKAALQKTNAPVEPAIIEAPPQSDAIDKLPHYTYADQLAQFANTEQLSQSQQTIKLNIDALKNYGMGEKQVEELIRSRKPLDRIDWVAPADGVVLARNVSLNQTVQKGMELFRLADLSRVWIEVTVSAPDVALFHAGASTSIILANGVKSYPAVVSEVPSRFDPSAGAFTVRLETGNPHYELKPGMPVDVELVVSVPDVIAVACDAVLDSGLRKFVYVEKAPCSFEARAVQTGRRWGGQIEIVGGVQPGERIVAEGNFLVDSESRIRLASGGSPEGVEADAVCGMLVDSKQAVSSGLFRDYEARLWHFCSTNCQQAFNLEPRRYAHKSEPSAAWASGTADPWCGRKTNAVRGDGIAPHMEASSHSPPRDPVRPVRP